MRLKIENGFYKFYPIASHELVLLAAQGFEVVQNKDYFTFPFLRDLPAYSIEGIDYAGITAAKTHSGTPQQVLLENKFIYDLQTKTLKSLEMFNVKQSYSKSDIFYFTSLPQAGAAMKDGKLKSLSGYWLLLGSGLITAEDIEYYAN